MQSKIIKNNKSNKLLKLARIEQHPSFAENLSEYFFDYSKNSTIHGLRYIGEKSRSVLERLCWLLVLTVSLYLCIYLISNVYRKWKTSPVVVTFANELTPIWEIPFPAITVCPETKAKQSVYNYTDAYYKYSQQSRNMTEEELKQFEQISLVCTRYANITDNKTIADDSMNFLYKIAPSPKDKFWWCKWNSMHKSHACDMLLTSVITDVGVCFTFNMLDREELFTDVVYQYGKWLQHGVKSTNWSMEKGFPKKLKGESFPRRTSNLNGLSFSLSMAIYEPDLDYICRGPVQGFRIILHNPAEMPRVYRRHFLAPFNQVLMVSIKPDMMKTSEELKSYDPQTRQCYFSYERQLKYFRIYTESNCDLECLTNKTLKRCGCVAYYMPRDSVTSICGQGNLHCMSVAEKALSANKMQLDIEISESDAEDSCNCLPTCVSLSYHVESSHVDYKLYKTYQALKKNTSDISKYLQTELMFAFKGEQFITTERRELYGLTDFIANCGGLLGLFIGFSFLSIVEICYFLSLRLMCNIRNYGRHFWSGSPEMRSKSEVTARKARKEAFVNQVPLLLSNNNNKKISKHLCVKSERLSNVIWKKKF